MQTYAEKYMVDYIADYLKNNEKAKNPEFKVLNVGAGSSLSIENQLQVLGCNYKTDRLDVENCDVKHPFVDKSYLKSIEDADVLEDSKYDLVFSNYVFEHVPMVDKGFSEVFRLLKNGGLFISTIPNPMAPEFFVSKATPLSIHKAVRGREAWPTVYGYKSIKNLKKMLSTVGFIDVEIHYFPAVFTYLYRFPVIKYLGKFYDWVITKFRMNALMGHVCFVARKK